MGKHKSKKSHKHKKKSRKDSSSEDEWVEKKNEASSSEEEKRRHKKTKKSHRRRSPSSSEDERSKRRNSSSSEEERIKKRKKKKRRYSTSSESSDSSDWEEKPSANKDNERNIDESASKREEKSSEIVNKREDWLSMQPTSFLTTSNDDRRRAREEEKRKNQEKSTYNPSLNSRELNPYWKNGGDGMPTFKKPTEDDTREYKGYKKQSTQSNWRKKTATEDAIEKPPVKDKNDYIYENISEEKASTSKIDKNNDDSGENVEVLTEKQMNALAAKLVKAEIMGNTALADQLKAKLENARKLRETAGSSSRNKQDEEVLLTSTDSKGFSKPIRLQTDSKNTKKRPKNAETHKDGQRERYFPDDDKYSLKDMFENEKFNSVAEQNEQFAKMAGKIRKNDDLDDVFTDNVRKMDSDEKVNRRNHDRAVGEHQRITKSLDNCTRCIQSDNMLKHLMISMGETVYLSLPSFEPLTEGHCLISSIRHATCVTQLDENEWEELMDFRKALVRLFASKGEDVIFFETATYLNRHPHMVWHAVPLPQEQGDLAPIYFKKAIDESEMEWSNNKKLVNLAGKNVRRCVPKGLPYFCVSFGLQEGYAHVIEDEQCFPNNFAQEIIGGMLDLHHDKWRKPKRQNFDDQKQRVLEFSKEWKDFDITKR